MKVKQKLVQT